MVILKPSDVLEDAKAPAECCKPVPSYQYHNCYGLPYQDHNYGAPPPPTPPQSPGKAAALPACIATVGVDEVPPGGSLGGGETGGGGSAADCGKSSPAGGGAVAVGAITTPTEEAVVAASADDSVTRCICDYSHDDGYMICCDECSVWQHIDCMGISRDKIPDTYLCEECLPRKVNRHKARLLQRRKHEEQHGGLGGVEGEEDKSRCRRRRPQQQHHHQSQNQHPTQLPVQQQQHGRRLNGSGDHCLSAVISDELCQAAVNATHCSERKVTRLGGTPVKQTTAQIAGHTAAAAAAATTTRAPCNRRDSARRRPRSSGSDTALSPELGTAKKKRSSRSTDNISTTDDESLVIDPCGLSCDVPSNHYDADVEELLATQRPEDCGSIHLDEKSLASSRTAWAVRSLPYGRKCLEAVSTVKADAVLLTYQGRFMRRDQFLIENPEATSRCSAAALFFNYAGTELCVVAALGDVGGGEARFIRRSCTPTAEVRHAIVGGKLHLAIVASQELCKGCEITIPFDGHSEFCEPSCECACGRGSACALKKGCSRRLRRKMPSGPTCAAAAMATGKESLCSLHVKQESMADDGQPPAAAPEAVPKRERRDSLRIVIPVSPPAALHDALSSPSAEGTHAAISSATSCGDPSSASDVLSPGGSGDKSKVVLSREERKVAAIVKAFEKLEKREERRKEALARLEHSRKCGGTCSGSGQPPPPLQSPSSASAAATTNGSLPCPPTLASPVKAIKVEKDAEPTGQQQQQQSASRRRSATGASADRMKETRRNRRVSEPHLTSSDNGGSGDSSHATEYHSETAMAVGVGSGGAAAAPAPPVSEPPLHCPTAHPAAAEIGSTSHGTLSPNYARLPKTKKHLLSEWYHETGCDRPPPDSVDAGGPEDGAARALRRFTQSPGGGGGEVTAPLSPQLGIGAHPRLPLHLAASWSPQAGTAGRALCGNSGLPTPTDSSLGSAKKRWLRQAMNEGGDHAEGVGGLLLSPTTGAQLFTSAASVPSSPAICRALLCTTSGTSTSAGAAADQAAALPQAAATTAHPTPHGAPGGDPVVAPPPKKRRLARESLSMDEQTSLPSPGACAVSAGLVAVTCSRPPSPTTHGDHASHAPAHDGGRSRSGSACEGTASESMSRDAAAVTLAAFATGTVGVPTSSPAEIGSAGNCGERSSSDGDSSRDAGSLSASAAGAEQTASPQAVLGRGDSGSSATEWMLHYDTSGTIGGCATGSFVSNGVEAVAEGHCTADQGDGLSTPAKKKVSLLEYRKRMRNGRDSDDSLLSVAVLAANCVSPPHGYPLPAAGDGGWPVSTGSLLPLPLFNGRAAADQPQRELWTPATEAEQPAWGSHADGHRRQQPADALPQPTLPAQLPPLPQRSHGSRGDRKPVSLDERLRLEFGLDADDEDAASSAPPSAPECAGVITNNGRLATNALRPSALPSVGRRDHTADAHWLLPSAADPNGDTSGQAPVDDGSREAALLRDPAGR